MKSLTNRLLRRMYDTTIISVLVALTVGCQAEVFAQQSGKAPKSGIELTAPVRVSLLSKKTILVSDYQQGMVATVSTKDLTVQRAFYTNGRPLGVANYGELLFVGNETTQRVQVRDTSGVWLYDLGGESGQVLQPTDIAVDAVNRHVLVVDGLEKVVKIFSIDGAFLMTIPNTYPDLGILANPTGIAIDPLRNEILVSDYGDPNFYIRPRIQIFSYTGALLKTITAKVGMLGVRFSRPQGLAVDNAGHIFMVDCYSGEVLVFDRDTGSLLKTISGFGNEPGQLRLPLDIVIDAKNKNLYITNNRGGRIEVITKGAVIP